MINERRKAPRVRVKLRARWEGAIHQEVAEITDLSEKGCFVLSGGAVDLKELIWIEIELPNQELIQLWGEVVDAAYDIGFALKFNSATGEGEARLRKFIETVFASDRRKK
ncbi:MAG TPA: PilZ domain-containing protein [Pyrinomonadaceae bacterium]|nr:PilZ domain-containing protein [Pyrinomonadaceae bacterium]